MGVGTDCPSTRNSEGVAMIEIKHLKNYSKVDGPCLCGQSLCIDKGLSIKGCRLCQPYTQGKCGPNYPVPAIRTIGEIVHLRQDTPPVFITLLDKGWYWSAIGKFALDIDCPNRR